MLVIFVRQRSLASSDPEEVLRSPARSSHYHSRSHIPPPPPPPNPQLFLGLVGCSNLICAIHDGCRKPPGGNTLLKHNIELSESPSFGLRHAIVCPDGKSEAGATL